MFRTVTWGCFYDLDLCRLSFCDVNPDPVVGTDWAGGFITLRVASHAASNQRHLDCLFNSACWANNNKNMKVPDYCPFWEESLRYRWIPLWEPVMQRYFVHHDVIIQWCRTLMHSFQTNSWPISLDWRAISGPIPEWLAANTMMW